MQPLQPEQQQIQNAFNLLQSGNRQQAEQICQNVLALNPNQPDALNLMGLLEKDRGSVDKAREYFKRGLKVAPGHLHLINSAGLLEKDLEHFTSAKAFFSKALELNPGYFFARHNLATVFEAERNFAQARALYQEVIRQQPRFVDSLSKLSNILEKEHELDEARMYAGRALEIAPGDYNARLTLANIAIREKNFDEVGRLLSPLLATQSLSPINRAVISGKHAYALEKSGDYLSAFKAYQAANRVLFDYYETHMRNQDNIFAPDSVGRIGKTVQKFEFQMVEDEIRSPVFLIGFPRSGTTLLDQILTSHSEISVLEEKPSLIDAYTRFPATEAGLMELENAGEEELSNLRKTYWDAVNRELGHQSSAPVIIDKLPLNAIVLLHIYKLFPRAKIITALRDPRDCVFSCYQQRFGMNLAMFQLLDLDSAVRYYDLVMNVISEVSNAHVFEMHFVRYENVITDFAAEIKALVGFLGLEWQEGLFDYRQTALSRDINTPSASQVIQPLYTSSVGKWKHYQEWIGSSFDPLSKWVKKWGYPV